MSNNDLKIDVDFDSLIKGREKIHKNSRKKRSDSVQNTSEENIDNPKLKHESKHPRSTQHPGAISISLNYDQIHLEIEYRCEDSEESPKIIDILSEIKEKL